MPKRRITRRQAWRINKIQDERRLRAQKKQQRLQQSEQQHQLGEEQQGLLIARYGTMVDVESATGQVTRCQLRQHLGSLVAGDRVIWRAMAPSGGVVVARLERHSVLGRPDERGQVKVIAANLDQMLITSAPKPQLNPYLIDSYLVAAEHLRITPIIILNKIDQLDAKQQATIDSLLSIYKTLNYPVIYTSAHAAHGLDELQQQLKHRISVFVGQSGVGKSSLINALLPGAAIRVGELTTTTEKGKHTTTTATLYHMKNCGDLIDSPGIREFGLWHMKPADIAQGFIEFREFLGNCKFRNCQHQQEPHCALKDAVKDGHIHPQRLKSYFRVIDTSRD